MTIRTLAAAAVPCVCLAGPASAQSPDLYNPKLLTLFKPSIAPSKEATVRIRCDDKDAILGTVVSSDGFILTKASELRGTVSVVLADGTAYEVEVVGVHRPSDLALLKLDLEKADLKKLKAVSFADSKSVPVGNWLAAPGTGADPLAVGIVSVATRSLTGFDVTDQGNNNRGYLGVLIDDAEDKAGARVTEVMPTGAAGKAGLKKGDVIFEVNGKKVTGHQQLREMLEDTRPGDKVTLKVMRKDEEMTFKPTLGGPDKNRSDLQNSMGSKLSGRRSGFPAVLQTDLVVDAENCGGPIVDLDGKVLGITIARAGRVETWVLPSETIRPILTELKAGKYPPVSTTVKKEKDGK